MHLFVSWYIHKLNNCSKLRAWVSYLTWNTPGVYSSSIDFDSLTSIPSLSLPIIITSTANLEFFDVLVHTLLTDKSNCVMFSLYGRWGSWSSLPSSSNAFNWNISQRNNSNTYQLSEGSIERNNSKTYQLSEGSIERNNSKTYQLSEGSIECNNSKTYQLNEGSIERNNSKTYQLCEGSIERNNSKTYQQSERGQ